jgi:hypothetical protein
MTSNHQLSTPVYKHLNGVESWDSADKDTRIAFYGAMKGRAYGREPTLDAWNWFLTGRTSRPADETDDDGYEAQIEDSIREAAKWANAPRPAEYFDIFPATGCFQCPWEVGDTYQRDCAFPDCSPRWKPSPEEPTPPHTTEDDFQHWMSYVGVGAASDADLRAAFYAGANAMPPEKTTAPTELSILERKVTVCAACLCASCWQGELYCDQAKTAGTVEKTIRELFQGNLREDSGYWFKDPNTGEVDYDAKSAAKRAWLAEKSPCCDGSGKIPYTDEQGRERVKRCNICQPKPLAEGAIDPDDKGHKP